MLKTRLSAPNKAATVELSLKSYLQQLSQFAFICDINGQLIFANVPPDTDAAQALDGQAYAYKFLDNSELKRHVDTVVSTGNRTERISIDLQTAAGESYNYKVDCAPWIAQDGSLAGCICTTHDVTEARRKEKELAESTNLLELVLEHMPVRVFWKNRDLVYLGCNTVFANDMGFEQPEQLIGKDDFATTMTREEAQLCRADDFQVIESQAGCYGSEEVIGSGDDKSWIRVSKVPLHDSTGEMIGVLGMYEGIDEQKKAQHELEHALRQERQLSELKTKFISTVSHEYRNPLATILATTDALIHVGDRFDEAKRRTRLTAIKNAVNRMTALMDDVLFIGRDSLLDANREHEAINVRRLCESIIEKIEGPSSDERRITVNEQGASVPVIGLPEQMQQLIQNLLENGLKYSDESVTLDLNWQETGLDLTVSDSGVGISQRDQSRIFDSFFRGENVGMAAGNGLGLYIAQRAVELHNGSINVESERGNGTTVRVQLPYKPTAF